MAENSLGPGIGVLIPTYNNAGTLIDVLRVVQRYVGTDVLVVDDGSTDSTPDLLSTEKGIHLLRVPENRGKGNALREGFNKARELGWSHAITIDSDGQHDPDELPLIAKAIAEHPTAMVMGARDMGMSEVPGRSSFGNRISNLCFRVETGIAMPDTQTGYRGWPLAPLATFKTITDRFGYEIESIVKLAWRGTPFIAIPVSVRYEFPERVSHFKPIQDFSKVGLTHAWLITLAIIWYWPKRLLSLNKVSSAVRAEFLRPEESSIRKAFSIGFGFFMGIAPLWGFQLLIGIPAAVLLKLNRVLFVAAANISIPPMIPFIILGSYAVGAPFVGEAATELPAIQDLGLEDIGMHLRQYLIGSVVLAALAFLAGTVLSFAILRPLRGK